MIALSPSEQLLISSDDLCEFYYTFRVSTKRAQRNAIGVKFHHSEVSHLQCYDPSQHTGHVYICLGTLAMGDALAVEIAQQSHTNLLQVKAGCMLLEESLQYRTAIPRGPFYELLTIDDHIGLQKVPLGGPCTASFARDVEVFERAGKAYLDVGLTAHPGKRQRRVSSTVVLGAEIDGHRGRVSAPRSRIVLLSFLTAVILHKGHVTRKLIQGLLGCWTHILLFRRPAFSIIDKLYSEGAEHHEDTVFKLSKESRNELLCLCLLAPVLQTNMRTSTPSTVYMMDASPFGGGICRAPCSRCAADEFWRHSEQRGFYTKLQQGPGMMLRELGLEHEEQFGEPSEQPVRNHDDLPWRVYRNLKDSAIIFDCIELFAGFGNWSRMHKEAGLRMHPGIERDATGRGYGDMSNQETFLVLAKLACAGSIREWHAAPPCWSFGTLRRPCLRSKEFPAGFKPNDPLTKEQTSLALRTAFLLTLACMSNCYISCEQPGNSVMFLLNSFQNLLSLGCTISEFCFCTFGSAFQKASKWIHNKPWYVQFEGKCSCKFKGRHFKVEGTFTHASIQLFEQRCKPSSLAVYGKVPRLGEAVSSYSAGYPLPLCQAMAAGSRDAHKAARRGELWTFRSELRVDAEEPELRPWHDDPEWVEDLCESSPFTELFRYRFKGSGHINCLECRVYKSWLKHCSKAHPDCRLVGILDSRVTMGAAAKGRSSSPALSRILRSSLCYVIGGGLYPGTLHCRSSWNRADGPSRDVDVPPPSRPEPKWLAELQTGRYELFDCMLKSAQWPRPLGRWFRLLLLLAGDVERNPGPDLGKTYTPRGELNLLGGFAQATALRMQRCLSAFESWCIQFPGLTLAQVLETSEAANLALKGYGLHLFRQGAPRYWLVYAITAVQQLRPEFRFALSGAWQVDKKWQLEEPGACRAVLSAPMLRAVLALALIWGWHCFAGIVALGFGGMLHPNEFLFLTRKDLVFPEDAFLEFQALYIFVRNPKTSRFARRQHVRVDDRSTQFLSWCIFGQLPLEQRLFPASLAVFRRQWNSILDRLEVPRRQSERGATPGVLRGSGATHEYLQSGSISQIQWKGRWSQLKTLEHYIQEVAAQLFMHNLTPKARSEIRFLGDHLGLLLQHMFASEYKQFCKAES